MASLQRDLWLILGDFNLIYKASNKNNSNLNRHLMGGFKAALDALEIKEINLSGRRYTWSNEQQNPIMTKIDRCFCSTAWDVLFPASHLRALPVVASDHCPLLLRGAVDHPKSRAFRFESFWPSMPGFKDVVTSAWWKTIRTTNALRRLHIKLSRIAKALKKWHQQNYGNIDMQMAVTSEIIGRLDVAMETRLLTVEEFSLRVELKSLFEGLAVILKMQCR